VDADDSLDADLLFASAAASSAYLTASEIFPLEARALAIAIFYALGTAIGGASGPLLFGYLIGSGATVAVAGGYTVAAIDAHNDWVALYTQGPPGSRIMVAHGNRHPIIAAPAGFRPERWRGTSGAP
jgi:MFS family permease